MNFFKAKLKPGVHFLALLPLVWLIWDFAQGNLSVNPIQDITLRTGKTALVLLVATLAVTPLNTVFGFRQGLQVRRILGLYTFFYVSIHLLVFTGLDYSFNWSLIQGAIFEKRYAFIGFAAWLTMFPLAVTSTRRWMKRLGRRWKRLHQLVYVAGILAVMHYIWLVKADIRQPLVFAGIVIVLLVLRIPRLRKAVASRRRVLRSWWRGLTSRLGLFLRKDQPGNAGYNSHRKGTLGEIKRIEGP